MESEWQLSSGRSKKKKQSTDTRVPLMSNVKVITPDVIKQYKSTYTTVSFELSKKFDDINKMFSTSSQYLDSKERINHNQHNHNKWQNKKNSECDDVYMILGNFNKLTIKNYDVISAEIKKYNIITFDEMTNIVENIYNKCINDIQFVNVYVKLLKFIIMECKWIVYDNNSKPITFRKYFIDYLESNFSTIINEVKNDTEDDEDEGDKLAKQKQIRKTYFVLICALFNESIIGNQLFRYIFTNVETAYLDTIQDEFMDRWLQMYDCASQYWTGTNEKYIIEKRQFISDNMEKFSVRIKILTERNATLASNNTKTPVPNDTNTNTNTNTNVFDFSKVRSDSVTSQEDAKKEKERKEEITNDDYDYEMLILSYQEYGSVDEWYETIKELKGENTMNKLLTHLVNKTSDLKIIFKLMAYLMNVSKEYNDFISEHISNNIKTISIKSYVTNAKKLLK